MAQDFNHMIKFSPEEDLEHKDEAFFDTCWYKKGFDGAVKISKYRTLVNHLHHQYCVNIYLKSTYNKVIK